MRLLSSSCVESWIFLIINDYLLKSRERLWARMAHILLYRSFFFCSCSKLKLLQHLVTLAFKIHGCVPWRLRNKWLNCVELCKNILFIISYIFKEHVYIDTLYLYHHFDIHTNVWHMTFFFVWCELKESDSEVKLLNYPYHISGGTKRRTSTYHFPFLKKAIVLEQGFSPSNCCAYKFVSFWL